MNDVVDFWAVDNQKITVILLSVFDDILIISSPVKVGRNIKTTTTKWQHQEEPQAGAASTNHRVRVASGRGASARQIIKNFKLMLKLF